MSSEQTVNHVGGQIVVKLGGSLLRQSDTPARLRRWLSRRSEDRLVLVVGGGAAVDHLRVWSGRHTLPETTAHWWSIELMAKNACAVRGWLPDFELTQSCRAIDGARSGRWIFDVRTWLRSDRTMPRSWAVTSDSIAVALAGQLGATRIALLKSRLLDLKTDSPQCQQLANSGFVDDFFPHAVRRFGVQSIELVDLRRGMTRKLSSVRDTREIVA